MYPNPQIECVVLSAKRYALCMFILNLSHSLDDYTGTLKTMEIIYESNGGRLAGNLLGRKGSYNGDDQCN